MRVTRMVPSVAISPKKVTGSTRQPKMYTTPRAIAKNSTKLAHGTRVCLVTVANARGSNPSRAALKISRAWEFEPAIIAPMVEVKPAM